MYTIMIKYMPILLKITVLVQLMNSYYMQFVTTPDSH